MLRYLQHRELQKMGSVREAGSGCSPVSYETDPDREGSRAQRSPACRPTAIGNSESLKTPPYTQKPDMGHVSEWRKLGRWRLAEGGDRGETQRRRGPATGGLSADDAEDDTDKG